MAFQEKDGFDVVFFMMYVSEWIYTDDRDNKVRIEYIDSVKYFEPSGLRTEVYQKIIIGYLRHARDIG